MVTPIALAQVGAQEPATPAPAQAQAPAAESPMPAPAAEKPQTEVPAATPPTATPQEPSEAVQKLEAKLKQLEADKEAAEKAKTAAETKAQTAEADAKKALADKEAALKEKGTALTAKTEAEQAKKAAEEALKPYKEKEAAEAAKTEKPAEAAAKPKTPEELKAEEEAALVKPIATHISETNTKLDDTAKKLGDAYVQADTNLDAANKTIADLAATRAKFDKNTSDAERKVNDDAMKEAYTLKAAHEKAKADAIPARGGILRSEARVAFDTAAAEYDALKKQKASQEHLEAASKAHFVDTSSFSKADTALRPFLVQALAPNFFDINARTLETIATLEDKKTLDIFSGEAIAPNRAKSLFQDTKDLKAADAEKLTQLLTGIHTKQQEAAKPDSKYRDVSGAPLFQENIRSVIAEMDKK